MSSSCWLFQQPTLSRLFMQVYLRDDYIVREGEVSREMYFLKSGAVQVRLCAASAAHPVSPGLGYCADGRLLAPVQVEVKGVAVTVLKKGSYFGELGLLRGARRSACVRAISDTCDLFVLSKVGP